MNKLNGMYNPRIVGTVLQDGEEIEVEFIPDELIKEQYEEELNDLLDKYDKGILVN